MLSVFTLAYGFGQLPAGWLSDRFGAPFILAIGICGVAAAGFLVGLSQTFIMVLVFLAVMGLLGGGYHPAAPSLISASVDAQHRGRALGFHTIGGSASYFSAPLIAAAIITVWGWRGAFLGLAFPSMILGIVLYIFIRRRSEVKRYRQETINNRNEASPEQFHWAPLVWFLILATITSTATTSVLSFVPLLLVDQFGISNAVAAASVSIAYAPGLIVGPLAGHLSDRWGKVPMLLAVSFLAAPVIYLLTRVPYGPLGLGTGALLILIGVITYVRMPVSESYLVGRTPARYRSTVLGVYFFSSMEGSGLLTPLMGYLIDHFGFVYTYSLVGIAQLVITIVCAVALWRNHG